MLLEYFQQNIGIYASQNATARFMIIIYNKATQK